MAFSIDTADLPAVYDFYSAREVWERIKPLRGQPDSAPRPLGRRSSNNPKTVRVRSDGSVVFQLHHTDCVEYRPDGALVLRTYPSISTVAFINALTPTAVRVSRDCQELTLMGREAGGDRIYQLATHEIVLQFDYSSQSPAHWVLDNPGEATHPWRHYKVDRKIANAGYREHNLNAFMDFFASYVQLKEMKPAYSWGPPQLGYTESMNMLREVGADDFSGLRPAEVLSFLRDNDRARWPEMAIRLAKNDLRAKQTRTLLMDLIKQHVDAVTFTEHEYLTLKNHSKVTSSHKLDAPSTSYL